MTPVLGALVINTDNCTNTRLIACMGHRPRVGVATLAISTRDGSTKGLVSSLRPRLGNVISLPLRPVSSVDRFDPKISMIFLTATRRIDRSLTPRFLRTNYIIFSLSNTFHIGSTAFCRGCCNFARRCPRLLRRTTCNLTR